MSTELEQGSRAWREARARCITGSRVGGILGVSPFTNPRKVMSEMVEESLGRFSNFSSEPMRWGSDHEETAVKLYTFLYREEDEVFETGFHQKGYLGASPDRLVGTDGLLEVKCPWAISTDKNPQFKSIEKKEYKHYWHQIQLQLYVTDRAWCDFFQWTPYGYQLEQVARDPDWLINHDEILTEFYVKYQEALEKAASGGPEERVGASARWAASAEAYRIASHTAAVAKADMEEALGTLKELMESDSIEQCKGGGIKLAKTLRKGSIDYKTLCEDQLTKPVLEGIEEDYRREGSVVWKIMEVDE